MSARRDRLAGVRKRADELYASGDMAEYADMLSRAAGHRRANGRNGEAARMLSDEADRWLGESKLEDDQAIPVGLAGDVEELAA
ncbi:hypothetical protein PBI_HUFFY_44 [Gordonia phage Huffy]|uniref:Uncharacterized protein n=1 Tax=Gordonia phage TZGordon TaxID=2744004 RepID=A0A6N0A590_9CAUD|nr:hypothetical protein KDJ61_gp71 [Gordonia phage TZGordon]AQY55646.1 hypothetical protein PBI_HUFFY_44 [Gordonia phage Huffy]AQY55728.1 hypothetical protein PBI_DINODARYN_44 [Gordonia phage DinoDaryn]QKO02965.1 hypothetical protein SEA_TZGORDON_45 [Gordonia phage TZGordon]